MRKMSERGMKHSVVDCVSRSAFHYSAFPIGEESWRMTLLAATGC
jgi:hypothetical protein